MTHPTLQQSIFNMMAFHDGQVDKSGVTYFNHPLRVMLRLGPNANPAEQHAALLHDVVEDTPVTLDILQDMGYSDEVLKMVALLVEGERLSIRFILEIHSSAQWYVSSLVSTLPILIRSAFKIAASSIETTTPRR